jgi:hypothetical protein
MKYQGPLILAGVMGVFMILVEFTPLLQNVEKHANDWLSIVAGFAMILGVLNLLYMSTMKIQHRVEGWPYAIATIIGFLVMAGLGIYDIEEGSAFSYMFNYFHVPLASTMFSLLAFFVASAAFRAFRARTFEATLLLVSAFFVMLGRVPIGELIHPLVPEITDWIMNVPNTAGQRAIMIGIALGVVSTSLRIILGIERSYMGGGD